MFDTRSEERLCRPDEKLYTWPGRFIANTRIIGNIGYAFLGGTTGHSEKIGGRLGVAFERNELIYDSVDNHFRQGRYLLMAHFLTAVGRPTLPIYIKLTHVLSAVTFQNYIEDSQDTESFNLPVSATGKVDKWCLDDSLALVYLCERPNPLLLSRFRADFQIEAPIDVSE